MSLKREKDQQYKSKWDSILNFLINNSGYPISGVARAGSRRQGDWNINSDLDIRFAIARDPPREEVYPKLKSLIKTNFKDSSVRIGSSYNVINIEIGELSFDLVLLSQSKFEKQVKTDKLERIK